MTSNKIYHNLKESEYTVIEDKYEFYFSSPVHKNRYLDQRDTYIQNELCRYSAKFKGGIIDSDLFIKFLLYKKTETRGFYVTYERKEIPENYKLRVIMDFNGDKV